MPTAARTPLPQRRPLAAFIYDQATTLPDGQTGRLRASLEAHIERCIAFLDAIDGDCDLEDGADDEAYLAGAAALGALADTDLEDDPGEQDADETSGIGDLDGLWEQGCLFGRGLRGAPEDGEAARRAAAQAQAISARIMARAA